MMRFDPPATDEHFYARALAIMAGPTRRIALLMRIVNLVYWMAITGALAWLCAQALDRDPPVVVRVAEVLTPALQSGEPLKVRYVVKRYRTCETDVSWLLFDGVQEVRRFGPVHADATGAPAEEAMIRAWPTPVGMAPGQGRLRVITAFECPGNYLQAIYPVTVVQPDLPFVILPGR